MLLILFFSFPTSLKKKPSYTQIKMSALTGTGTTVTEPSIFDRTRLYLRQKYQGIKDWDFQTWKNAESDHPWLAKLGEWEGLLYGGGIILCLFMWLLAMGSVFESSNDGMMFASFIILLSIFIAWYLHRTIRRRDPLFNLGAFGFTVTLSSLFFMFFYFSALVYGSAIMNTETIWILNITLSCVGMLMLLATRYFKWGYDSGKPIQLISEEDSELLEKAHKIIREAAHKYYFEGYYKHWEEVKFDAQETLNKIFEYAQKTKEFTNGGAKLQSLVREILSQVNGVTTTNEFNDLLKEYIIENYRKLLRVPNNHNTTTPGPESSTGTPGAPGASNITAAAAAANEAAKAANSVNTTEGDPRAEKMDRPGIDENSP